MYVMISSLATFFIIFEVEYSGNALKISYFFLRFSLLMRERQIHYFHTRKASLKLRNVKIHSGNGVISCEQ